MSGQIERAHECRHAVHRMLWMMDDFQLDRDVDAYYSQAWDEDVRLRSGIAELELVRTRTLFRRYLGTDRVPINLNVFRVPGGVPGRDPFSRH
jgi:hypothetical protein